MRISRLVIGILTAIVVVSPMHGQSFYQKFSYGARVGPNLWLNDLNDRRVGFGAEAFARWGVTPSAAIGFVLSYESLKSAQVPPTTPVPYLGLSAFQGAATSWIFLSSSKKFVPYLSAGIGGMTYARRAGDGLSYPGERAGFSLVVPVALGFEAFVKKDLSVSFDLGYRILNNSTDDIPAGSDSYPTVKLGVSFSMGSNAEDDDDGDGLTNGKEADLGTDPESTDSDKDLLNDADEVRIYKTMPLKGDTDADRLVDGDEVWRFRTDPLKADTDGDGLNDGDEIYKHNVDPLKVDSDKDGLSDGEEVLGYKTDPQRADSDGDTVTDQNEIFVYKTDPMKADTDGGGMDDGVEIRRVTNPLNPADDLSKRGEAAKPPLKPAPVKTDSAKAAPVVEPPKDTSRVEIGKAQVIEGLTFAPWESKITPETEGSLEKLLQLMSLNPTIEVEIRGHTDGGGARDQNITLSRNRARAARNWLVKQGIERTRISVKGFGPDQPIAPNDTDDNKAKNRRIEFVRTK
jgi:outer membrane protein OmpA-like peptidoglycan-associated protein